MGYNRSGERRKQRLKRQKREVTRLLAKMETNSGSAGSTAKAEPKKSAKRPAAGKG